MMFIRAYSLGDIHKWIINGWEKLSRIWIIYDMSYEWNSDTLEVPKSLAQTNDPGEVYKMIGFLYFPNAMSILNAVESLGRD